MAKFLINGFLQIEFDDAGLVGKVIGNIRMGDTEDAEAGKTYYRSLSLTQGQKDSVEAFIASKLADLKFDEDLS